LCIREFSPGISADWDQPNDLENGYDAIDAAGDDLRASRSRGGAARLSRRDISIGRDSRRREPGHCAVNDYAQE